MTPACIVGLLERKVTKLTNSTGSEGVPAPQGASGEGCYRAADGTLSGHVLHEQLTAGVDDSEIRRRTRAKVIAEGVLTEAEATILYGEPDSGASESD